MSNDRHEIYETCQTAREYGSIFHDDFLRWCFLEGLYTPFQLLIDMAVLLIGLAVGIGIIAFYWITIFGLPGDRRGQ